jgi:peptide/nickel transport system permease protein
MRTANFRRGAARVGVLHDRGVRVGVLLFAFVVFIAIFGSHLSSQSPYESIGIPGVGPGDGHLLGLDFEGRDVLARMLYGGISTLTMAASAAVLVYIFGTFFGLLAGYSRSLVDPLLMRTVDVVLSIPSLLLCSCSSPGSEVAHPSWPSPPRL